MHALARRPLSLVLLTTFVSLGGCGELVIDEQALLEAAGGADPIAIEAADLVEMEQLARRYTLEVVDAQETADILDEVRGLSATDALIFRAAVRAVLLGVPLEEGDVGSLADLAILDEATLNGGSFLDLTEAEVGLATGGMEGALGQIDGALCDEQAACALVEDWPLSLAAGACTSGCFGAFAADRVTDDPASCGGGTCAVRVTFYPSRFTVIDGVTAATDCVLDHAGGVVEARQGERFEVRLSHAAVQKCGLPDEVATDYLKGRLLAR
jgi:hypothetical protein